MKSCWKKKESLVWLGVPLIDRDNLNWKHCFFAEGSKKKGKMFEWRQAGGAWVQFICKGQKKGHAEIILRAFRFSLQSRRGQFEREKMASWGRKGVRRKKCEFVFHSWKPRSPACHPENDKDPQPK